MPPWFIHCERAAQAAKDVHLKRQAAAQFRSVGAFYTLLADGSCQSRAGNSSQANTQKLIIWHLTKCAPRQYIGREIFLGGSVWWKSEIITPSVIDRLVRKSTAAALWNFAKQLSFSLPKHAALTFWLWAPSEQKHPQRQQTLSSKDICPFWWIDMLPFSFLFFSFLCGEVRYISTSGRVCFWFGLTQRFDPII